MTRTLLAALATAAVAGTAMQAQACNPLLNKDYGKHVAPAALPAAMLAKNHHGGARQGSIVGLWHDVRTASDGTLFMEGFDTWVRDGSENELGKFPPATGDLCVGAWKRQGGANELTTHVTWLYDANGNWLGTLNITQTSTVSADGNGYTGPFDAKFYDTNGNQFQEVTGNAAGERLVQ